MTAKAAARIGQVSASASLSAIMGCAVFDGVTQRPRMEVRQPVNERSFDLPGLHPSSEKMIYFPRPLHVGFTRRQPHVQRCRPLRPHGLHPYGQLNPREGTEPIPSHPARGCTSPTLG